MFDFTNAGEQWTAISAVASFLVIIVALFPLIREMIHNSRKKSIIRNRILFEVNNIHESFFGKILAKIELFNQNIPQPYTFYENDVKYFSNIEDIYDETISLTKYEKEKIKDIIGLFRRNTYRKLEDGSYYMMTYDIIELEKTSNDLLIFIKMKLKQVIKDEYIRNNSYNRISEAAKISGKQYPSYNEILAILHSDRNHK